MYYGGFYRHEANGDWFFFVDGSWEFMGAPDKSEAHPLIPRPAKTEWVDGLPNVGDLVRHPRYANPCELKWLGKANCVIESDFGDEYFAAFEDLEPLQTPEQRQREELVDLIENRSDWGHSQQMVNELADAILSKYNLTEK